MFSLRCITQVLTYVRSLMLNPCLFTNDTVLHCLTVVARIVGLVLAHSAVSDRAIKHW